MKNKIIQIEDISTNKILGKNYNKCNKNIKLSNSSKIFKLFNFS